MFKKLRSFHKRNQGKQKKRNRCKSSSLGKISSSSGLPTPRHFEFLRSDLFSFFLTLQILTSLHMTKIITHKNPRRQASQITKKITTNTRIVGFLARRSDKKTPSKKVRKQTKEAEWRDGLAEKGTGNVQLNPGKNGG